MGFVLTGARLTSASLFPIRVAGFRIFLLQLPKKPVILPSRFNLSKRTFAGLKEQLEVNILITTEIYKPYFQEKRGRAK